MVGDPNTPNGIVYTTPQNDVASPSAHRPPPLQRWTPPSIPKLNQSQLRLIWNGLTKADFQLQFDEALAQERSGRMDEAEAKLRSALEGFSGLLSTTHPEALEIAYRLATFYAQHFRTKDADAVLDWITQAHLEDFTLDDQRTLNHVLKVADCFRDWGRPEDGASFLKQAMHEIEKAELDLADVAGGPSRSTNDHPNNTGNSTLTQERVYGIPIPLDGTIDPAVINAHLHREGTTSQGHADLEVLFRLIEHCDEHPRDLTEQSILCRTIVLGYYNDINDEVGMTSALNDAEQALWKVLRPPQKQTNEFFETCIGLTQFLVKAERYDAANDLFTQIESEAQEIFGANHTTTIDLVQRIGILYQNLGRWPDAVPRFEQALAACLSRYNERHKKVKLLELALENGRFDMHADVGEHDDDATTIIRRRNAQGLMVFTLGPRSYVGSY
jgi:tetratricopeptide (TPR) repeat protein